MRRRCMLQVESDNKLRRVHRRNTTPESFRTTFELLHEPVIIDVRFVAYIYIYLFWGGSGLHWVGYTICLACVSIAGQDIFMKCRAAAELSVFYKRDKFFLCLAAKGGLVSVSSLLGFVWSCRHRRPTFRLGLVHS